MLRELDQRQADGLRVIGYYDTELDADENVTICVLDKDQPGQITVWERIPAGDFTRAFKHPFALPDAHKQVLGCEPEAVAA